MATLTETYDAAAKAAAPLRLMRLTVTRKKLVDRLAEDPESPKAAAWAARIANLDASIDSILIHKREHPTGNPVGTIASAPTLGGTS